MPTTATLGLSDSQSRYGVFYKYFDPATQRLLTGFKLVNGTEVKLKFDEALGKDVIFFEGYFGAYWAVSLSRSIVSSEIPLPKEASEPIINRSKIVVVNSVGIVKENDVLTVQKIPTLTWTVPTIKFLSASRSVLVSASVQGSQKVSACKLDLFESTNAASGSSFDVLQTNSFEVAIKKKTLHSLFARFRCLDDSDRISITSWSASITIPESESSSDTKLCDETNPAQLQIRTRDSSGQYTILRDLQRVAKCKYSVPVYSKVSGSFYIASKAGDFFCGKSGAQIIAGTNTLSCRKSTLSEATSDFFTIPLGNFNLDIDFSQSTSVPTIFTNLIKCPTGDMYAVFSQDLSGLSVSSPSETYKFTHLGACQFLYERTSIPLSGNGYVAFRNKDYSYSCGSTVSMLNTGYGYGDVCSTDQTYFNMPSSQSGVLHRFFLDFGESFSHDSSNSGGTSSVRYAVESSCPNELQLKFPYISNLKYTATKSFACSYTFTFPTDNVANLNYNFKISKPDGNSNCGGSISGSSLNLNCSEGAEVAFSPTEGALVKLTIEGNGQLGTLTNGSINYPTLNCSDGLYLQNSFSGTYEQTPSNKFTEVSPCIFEKYWKPASPLDKFFVSTGGFARMCSGFDANPASVMIGGTEINLQCMAILNPPPSGIRPTGLISNVSYKIRVDRRFDMMGIAAKVSVKQADPQLNLLFVIDNSSSMAPYQNRLTSMLPNLLSSLGSVDWRIAVVNTSSSCLRKTSSNAAYISRSDYIANSTQAHADFAGLVSAGESGNPVERGILMATDAMQETGCGSGNISWRRPVAQNAVFLLTDENNCGSASNEGCPGQPYESSNYYLQGVGAHVPFHALLLTQEPPAANGSDPSDPNHDCENSGGYAEPPDPFAYYQTVSQTGGRFGDICRANYPSFFNQLSSELLTSVQTLFQ